MHFPTIEELQKKYPKFNITDKIYRLAKDLYPNIHKARFMEEWVYPDYFIIDSVKDTAEARKQIDILESLKQARSILR